MNRLSRSIGIAVTSLVVTVATQGTALAADSSRVQGLFPPNKIIGLWDVQVVISNCDTGAPMGSFDAMHKFEMGGTGQVVPATNPTALSAHLAVWNHVRHNHYRQAIKFYRFNESGAAIGWNVIRNEITVNQHGNEFVGSGVAEFYALDGSYLSSVCPSLIGTRFSAE